MVKYYGEKYEYFRAINPVSKLMILYLMNKRVSKMSYNWNGKVITAILG